MPNAWLEDKVAVVTGAGRGIGRGVALLMAKEGAKGVVVGPGAGRGIVRGVALLMAKEGAKVVVVDPGVNMDGSGRDAGPAGEVVAEIEAAGGTAVPSLESVGTVAAGDAIIKTALDAFGRIDILVNVAGILRDR